MQGERIIKVFSLVLLLLLLLLLLIIIIIIEQVQVLEEQKWYQ